MSTCAVTPSAPSIDLNDPRLTEPQPDYRAIVNGQVTERYQSAAMSMQRYALSLDRFGKPAWSSRLLCCCRSGSEAEVCEHGRYAHAYKHHCGDPFCIYDSNGRYRFNKWAATRDPESFKTLHTAFELKMEGACECDIPWAEAQIHTAAKLAGIAWAMLEACHKDHVTVDAYAERISNTAVRVVFAGSLTYTQLQYWAEKMAVEFVGKHEPGCRHGRPQITIKRGDTIELFHWAFNGFKELAALDPDRKAELRIALADHRSVEARGDRYRPMSKERMASDAAEPCICPVCKDHTLTAIPPAERHTRPIKDILAEYDHVNWGREHDSPFLIRRVTLTDNSAPAHGNRLTVAMLAESPPS
jgi:hypothetical protein